MGQDQAGGALHAGVSMYFAAMHVVWHANWQHSGHCEILVLRAAAPILHELHRNYEDWHQYAPWEQPIWQKPPYMPDQNRSGDQNLCGERWNVAQHDAKHNGVEESGGYCETSGWWRQVPMPSHRWIAQRTNAFSAKDAGAQVTAIAIWSMTYWSTERCVACLSSLMLVRET